MSDLTQQEFIKMYLNFNYNAFSASNFYPYQIKISNSTPIAFNRRDKVSVNPVPEQGAFISSTTIATLDN